MRRALRWIDTVLMHPWTTRVGAIQAVVSAGVLAAGLVGGAVTLVFGFATGWAVLTAVGAFGLAASGMTTLLEHRKSKQPALPESADGEIAVAPSELRTAIGAVIEELEHHRDLIRWALEDDEWWHRDRQLLADAWQSHGPKFAQASQGEAHGECRSVYRAINELNWRHRHAWADRTTPATPLLSEDDREIAVQALAWIDDALTELDDLPRDVPNMTE